VVAGMLRTGRLAVLPLLLLALLLPAVPRADYRPRYFDGFGNPLPPNEVDYVLRASRLPEGTPGLEVYREFAARYFYASCSVRADMALLFLYYVETSHWHEDTKSLYVMQFAVVYDPLTRRILTAYLNGTYEFPPPLWYNNTLNLYVQGLRPIGYQMWLAEVDAEAFARGSLVINAWYIRSNATHIHNFFSGANGRPLRAHCPLPKGFNYSMYFTGPPTTVTVTQTTTQTVTQPPTTVTRTLAVTETLTQTATRVLTYTETATVTETVATTLPPATVTETLTETVTETRVETYTTRETVTRERPPVTMTLVPVHTPPAVDTSVAAGTLAFLAGVGLGLALRLALRRSRT